MALDDLLDEHEQSERVLAWLRRNGASLVGGIALGLAAIAGWKWWDQHRVSQRGQLADQFQQTIEAVAATGPAAASKVSSLPEGPYRSLALLTLAKSQVDKGELDAAASTLRAARFEDPELAEIVNARLARVLVDSKKADEALRVLAKAEGATALEARGDALFALGRADEARDSYSRALTRLDVDAAQRRVLELKLTQVGGTPTKTEARS